jgi:hypothetical protein
VIVAAPPPQLDVVRTALVRKLRREYLSVKWANCFRDARTYRTLRVTRCKVNFGDPHIVQYCVVIIAGRVVTDHERRAIRCGVHPDPQLASASSSASGSLPW